MKPCIVIPAHNEARTIGQLIHQLKNKNLDAVVIDDGSSDPTGSVAKEQGAVVLTHEKKKGKGASLRDGFTYALAHDFDGVITMDGDLQHAVEDIDQFISKAKDSPASVITGTRMNNPQGMPKIRLLTNRVMSGMISSLCRQKIPDTQCGFRYIGREVLENIQCFSCDFEIETEVLVKASRKGFPIHSVPIRTIYRNETSKINPALDTFRFLLYIIKETWRTKP
ncbi:MAG: glycosyltransferase family 2 protein [Candidatus Omnitrophota bacterium]